MYVSLSLPVKSAACAAFALSCFTVSAPVIAAVRATTPQYPARARDSFLYPPANSTPELVRAVEKDRTLRLRYARHFHVTEDQFLHFAQRALITYRLPAARNVTTYGVTRSGRIYPVRERLPEGTQVWATHSGVPILKWRCANPLTDRLPGLFARAPRSTRPAETVKTAAADEAPGLVSTAAASALPPTIGVDSLAPLLAAPPAVGDFVLPLAPLSGGGAASAFFAAAGSGGGGAFPWFAVPFAGMLFPHHSASSVPPGFFGSSTETVTTPPLLLGDTPILTPGGGGGVAVVPEAGTGALLLLGAAAPLTGILLRRRKTNR